MALENRWLKIHRFYVGAKYDFNGEITCECKCFSKPKE